MTEQENVPHATKKCADMALAKRRISRDSNEAVYEGRLTLEEARELGRDGSPYGPAPRTLSKDDRMRTCMCG